jgi:hypothetical protein
MTPADGVLGTVTAALWPLVMVSATAPLIISIGNAHANLSARVRQLGDERRDPATAPARRESVREQLYWFRVRIRLSHAAHVLLYLGILCFIGTVAIMSLKPKAAAACVWIFFSGTILLLAAVVMQLVELSMAHRTIDRDLAS